MKICSCPDEVSFAEPDYARYDPEAELERERAHRDQLRDWLRANGWPGPHTGDTLSSPRGDGYAEYMYADGPKPMLVHLPYGDAWHAPDVRFLPMREILSRLRPHRSAGAPS